MTAIVRVTDEKSPLTEELQGALLEALGSGLKPRWVALLCNVAPTTLRGWLEQGSKRDARQPYRGFVVKWTNAEARLMREYVEKWLRLGDSTAYAFLKERWPRWWGPKAEGDYEALGATMTNAEELAQFEAILANPEEFGVHELFAKHNRLRPDGT
jgi:hypothetical protein